LELAQIPSAELIAQRSPLSDRDAHAVAQVLGLHRYHAPEDDDSDDDNPGAGGTISRLL